MTNRCALFATLLGSVVGCTSAPPRLAVAPPEPPASAFSLAIEGLCPKLQVQQVGHRRLLVFGTYGLDEGTPWSGRATARAAQAVGVVGTGEVRVEPAWLEGLPKTASGWADGDLEIGGGEGAWLERTVRAPAAPQAGALFDVTFEAFTWNGFSWVSAAARGATERGTHATLPPVRTMCSGERGDLAFAVLAAERVSDGTTFVAGRCEDASRRPVGPVLLARLDPTTGRWVRATAPASVLFEGPDAIVNVGIVAVDSKEVWIHAFRPFGEPARERGYLVRWTGSAVSVVPSPEDAAIVSLTRSSDGAMWAVTGTSKLYRADANGRWDAAPTALPPVRLTDRAGPLRLLEVHHAGGDLWLHGAVPVVRDGTSRRIHLLFTTAPWHEPQHCDRTLPPSAALHAGATAASRQALR